MQTGSSQNIGQTSTENETFESAESTILNESMSSADGFHARIFPTPDEGQDLKAS